jgi:hypothetical protein
MRHNTPQNTRPERDVAERNGGREPEQHHPLDDDAELEHIGQYSPPPIDVSPDSGGSRSKRDAPPMIKGGEESAASGSESSPSVRHVPPLGPNSEGESESSSDGEAGGPTPKIRTFEQRLGRGGHETQWQRKPNVTGTGAIHVKSFHCKLTGDSLEYLDSQINEWLDEHPEYEVKMVTTSVGEWTGKLKEPALIVNVWV